MGIDLGDVVVRRPTTLSALSGQRIAFDAWNVLYQFLASIRQPDGTPLKNREGHVTSHLAGTLYRTSALVDAGVRPVFVFDGPPHPLKAETLAARSARKQKAQGELDAEAARLKARVDAGEELTAEDYQVARTKAQQTSRLTAPMVTEAKELLQGMGVPVLQAPGEGEAEAAWLCAQNKVHAASSQDFDALLFGTPRLLRNVAVGGRRKLPGKQVWVDVQPEEIPLPESLSALGLTREQLVDAALLVGTDFHPGVHGVGAKKAVALIAKEGSLEALLDRLAANPSSATSAVEKAILEQRGNLDDRAEVRRIFLGPAHAEEGSLEISAPNPEKVRKLMVERNGFSPERVDGVLDRLAAARGKSKQQTLF